jgi:hypothetical protein
MPAESNNTAGDPGGGPNTLEGKQVARWNSARHGIRSLSPVVPGVEKPEDWEEYRDGIREDLASLGALELALAERVALLSWRLHHGTRYETETIARSQESVVEDLHDRRRFEWTRRWTSKGSNYLACPSGPGSMGTRPNGMAGAWGWLGRASPLSPPPPTRTSKG